PVWAYSHNEDWLWVDGICERQDMGANLDDLFRLSAKWRPLGVGIEVSGQQGGYIPLIQREMVNKDVYFHMVSEKGSSTPG
ncbi:hypothetical protein Q2422_26090, partial [Escherichia coli]|nr:hypothetical protein [Escherichia coli]